MPTLLRHLMMQSRLMAPEGDPPGGDGKPPAAPVAPVTPPAKTGNPLLDLPIEEVPDQWREHAKELRRENAKLREITKTIDEAAAQKKLDEAVAAALEAERVRTQELIENERKASHRRIINGEVKAIAVSMGIQDLDAVKLIDTSKLAVDEATGEVTGVTELLEAFKTAKPYLFKEPAPRSTSHAGDPPPKEKPKMFDARTATDAERAAEAARMGLKIKK